MIVSWNLGDGPDSTKFWDLMRLATEGATVIGLQEAGDRGRMLETFCETGTWRLWSGVGAGAASVPILYDEKAVGQPRKMRSRLAVGRRFVGPGAGPPWSKPKVVNVLVLRNGTRVLNTHFTPSAGRQPKRRFRRRRNHYTDQAIVLARMIGKGKRMRRTVVTADFNADENFPLLKPVRDTGITGWTKHATHVGRAIDHVLGRPGTRRLLDLSSDHRAVLAD